MKKEQFKIYRQSLGMTIPKLSLELGVSARQCARYESGESKIPSPVGKYLTTLTLQKGR